MLRMYKNAIFIVLKEWNRLLLFLVLSFVFFALLYMIPVWTTPGDDIIFHFSLLSPWVFTLMILLALGNGLLMTMQFHIHQQVKRMNRLREQAKETVTAFGIFTSALLSTMACAACYSSLLAFLGLGFTAFIVEYRLFISFFALALTFTALHFTAKRVDNKCSVCAPRVSPKSKNTAKVKAYASKAQR